MKKLLTLVLLLSTLFCQAQKTTDAELNQRLKEYMALNKQMDFEKVMDYTHPKLFTIAPREAILQSFEQVFKSEELKFSFDSMAVISVGPVYKYQNSFYRKIDYFMAMTIGLADSIDLNDRDMVAAMEQSFKSGFPGKKITIDPKNNAIRVAGKELMFAIKDKDATQWMFLGYDKSKPQLVQQLYPKQVRQYFKLQ